MKHFVIAIVALALSATASLANWTGCKFGGFAGVSASHTETDVSTTPAFLTASLDGFSTQGLQGGVLAGCDLQVGAFVLGGFVDYAFAENQWKTNVSLPSVPVSIDVKAGLGDTWAVGGRAGYLVTPTTLLYGNFGFTRAKGEDLTIAVNGNQVASFSIDDPQGWFAGAGFEAIVAPNISIALSYRFVRYDSEPLGLPAGVPVAVNFDTDTHTARIELAYRFGWSEPLQPMR